MARPGRGDRPAGFALRDLADYAIDHVRPGLRRDDRRRCSPTPRPTPCATAPTPTSRSTAASATLWDPLLDRLEARHGVRPRTRQRRDPPPASGRNDWPACAPCSKPATTSPSPPSTPSLPLAASLADRAGSDRAGRRRRSPVHRRQLRRGLASRAMGLGPRSRARAGAPGGSVREGGEVRAVGAGA